LTTLARLARQADGVGIIAYCLTRNAYHIIAEERIQGAGAKFLHKLSVSYATYFQYKYKYAGKLFKGSYKDDELVNIDKMMLAICKIHNLPNETNQDPLTYPWSSYKKYLAEQAPWLYKKPITDFFKTNDLAKPLKEFTDSVGL
jgi:hypothetical protein